MTGSELLFVVGDIDADLIERAERGHSKRSRVKPAWSAAVAACILIAIIASVINRPATQSSPNESVATSVPIVLEPMICVNSTLYVMQEEQAIDPNIAPDQELLFLGKISSYVESTIQPSEELQSNSDIVGAEVYQQGSDIIVFYNGHCWVYRPCLDTQE